MYGLFYFVVFREDDENDSRFSIVKYRTTFSFKPMHVVVGGWFEQYCYIKIIRLVWCGVMLVFCG